MQPSVLKQILHAAVQAPSGDNVQPWELTVSADNSCIYLHNLPNKDHSAYNFQQSASYISHGAVIENIVIACQHFGYSPEISLFPDNSQPDYVACIRLKLTHARKKPLYPAIFKRQTNRFSFRPIALTDKQIHTLSDSVKKTDNCHLHLVTQKEQINTLATIFKGNDQIVFENKMIHHFLFDKIRWSMEEIESTRDGMSLEALGLSRLEQLFFPLLRSWNMVQAANMLGLSKIIALKSRKNYRNASALGIISIKGQDRIAFINGGRAMQRLWLTATQLDLALQPVIGLPLLIHRLKKAELIHFPAVHQRIIKKASQQLHGLFALNKNETIIMGFRLGGNTYKPARTLRKLPAGLADVQRKL
jgi:nitroreductase